MPYDGFRPALLEDDGRNDLQNAGINLWRREGAAPLGLRPNPVQDFAAACRTMLPLVEFTTRALGLEP